MSGVVTDTCELSSYAEVIDVITNLRFLVRERRRRDRMTLQAVASTIGVATSTVYRFEQGRDVSTSVLVALIAWVGDEPIPAATETTEAS